MQDIGNEGTDAQFAKAMALTGAEFLDCVDYITHVSCTGALRGLRSPVMLQEQCARQSMAPELRQLKVDSCSWCILPGCLETVKSPVRRNVMPWKLNTRGLNSGSLVLQ